MNNIGEKIKNVRKKKGLSQEELADSAKVNLRTIQRIESSESEPRGKTFHLICDALAINAEEILDYGKQENNSFLVYFHLSVLIGLVIPSGNIVIPFILWLTKKDKIIGLKSMGANLINFQIIWSLIVFLTPISGIFLSITHTNIGPGNFIILLFVMGTLYILNIILAIIFAIKVRNGKIKNYYPSLIRVIK